MLGGSKPRYGSNIDVYNCSLYLSYHLFVDDMVKSSLVFFHSYSIILSKYYLWILDLCLNITLGRPWSLQISFMNFFSTCISMCVLWIKKKCAYFLSLLMTTKMELPSDICNPIMNSIDIYCHFWLGMCNVWSKTRYFTISPLFL